jgi:hypothetical protein
MPSRVRAPWRSRVSRSLQVQKIDSIRCRIGARWGPLSGLVFAAGPDDRGVEFADSFGERAAGVALVAEHCFAAAALAAGEQFESELSLVALGRGQRERSRGAVWSEDRVEPEAPEVAGVRRAVAVVGSISELGTLDGLAAAGALDRGRVDQQQLIVVAGALARKHAHQPLDRVRELTAALEVTRLRGQPRKQMPKALAGALEEAPVAGDPHDRLGDTERDDLRVCDDPAGVPWRFRQEIVRRAVNGDAESVEVGVHRGLLVDGAFSTADFGLSATNPSNTVTAVESTI